MNPRSCLLVLVTALFAAAWQGDRAPNDSPTAKRRAHVRRSAMAVVLATHRRQILAESPQHRHAVGQPVETIETRRDESRSSLSRTEDAASSSG